MTAAVKNCCPSPGLSFWGATANSVLSLHLRSGTYDYFLFVLRWSILAPHGENNMEQGLIYFDNAATVWPKPEGVYKFMDHFYRTQGVNPGRSGYDLAMEAGSLLANLRKRLTRSSAGTKTRPKGSSSATTPPTLSTSSFPA